MSGHQWCVRGTGILLGHSRILENVLTKSLRIEYWITTGIGRRGCLGIAFLLLLVFSRGLVSTSESVCSGSRHYRDRKTQSFISANSCFDVTLR